MSYINSQNISVFPSSLRGLSTAGSYADGKYTSEPNLTGIIRSVTDRESFIIKWGDYPEGSTGGAELVIHGYYFKITGTLPTASGDLYANIRLDSAQRLISDASGSQVNALDDSNGFRGLSFDTSSKTGTNVYSLQVFKNGQLVKENFCKINISSIYTKAGQDLLQIFINSGLITEEGELGVLQIPYGGTGVSSVENIRAGKDDSGKDIRSTYGSTLSLENNTLKLVSEKGSSLSSVTLPNTGGGVTYTFAGGTNKFTVTPSNGTSQEVSVTPSIDNNITGSGSTGSLVKFSNTNTITSGPTLNTASGSENLFLTQRGTWKEVTSGGTGNISGSGTNGSLVKFSGTNTITDGPALSSGGTGFLKQDGSWATPTNTTYSFNYDSGKLLVGTNGGTPDEVIISNNITRSGSGNSNYLVKFNSANTITNGPELDPTNGSESVFLTKKGTWASAVTDVSGYIQKGGSTTAPSLNSNAVRNIYISTNDPSGGSTGDVWIKYTE